MNLFHLGWTSVVEVFIVELLCIQSDGFVIYIRNYTICFNPIYKQDIQNKITAIWGWPLLNPSKLCARRLTRLMSGHCRLLVSLQFREWPFMRKMRLRPTLCLVKASTKVSSKDPCKTLHTNNPNVSTLLWAQVLTIRMQSNNLIWGKCHKCISLGPTLNIIMIQLVAKFAQKMI